MGAEIPSASSQTLRKPTGIDEGYYVAVPPDPTEEEAKTEINDVVHQTAKLKT